MKRFRLTPPQTISLSFAAMILVGALLLSLPIASRSRQSAGFLNALFTATSANCVTGLVVVNTQAQWSAFGKVVILALIQLGGLGFVVVMTGGLLLFRQRISLGNRLVVQAAFNQDSIGGMVRLVRHVLLITLVAEGAGALVLTAIFLKAHPFPHALALGVFHAVSAFCNAGFDILGADSLIPYQTDWALNLAVMTLIVVGGLGFMVVAEVAGCVTGRRGGRHALRWRLRHLSLHSKVALLVTGALILSGAALTLWMEWGNPKTLGPLAAPQKGLVALFHSVTLRTCGFDSIGQQGMTEATKLLSSMYMLVGGSPAGTAGGMKTVTLGVILIAMHSVLRGRDRLEALGRALPFYILQKALTVASLMLLAVLASTLALFFAEGGSGQGFTLIDYLFECASAVGTVGLTTGVTPFLSPGGKAVVILCMFLGRLSPVTVVMALNMRLHRQKSPLRYVEEGVIIG